MRLAGAIFVLAASGTAQATTQVAPLEAEVHLAGDPQRQGPTAWTWLRRYAIPRLSEDQRDPFRELSIHWTPSGVRMTAGTRTADHYAHGTIRWRGKSIVDFSCSSSGHETWRCAGGSEVPVRVRSLAESLGLGVGGVQTFDLATLIAHLAEVIPHDDSLRTLLLTSGAAECGDVQFAVSNRSRQLAVRGQSHGGLILPAIIVAAATMDSPNQIDEPLELTERDKWQVLAFAARHDTRLEAAAQLARLGDPAAIETLERLLWTEDATRASAMEGLIRAGATDSLQQVVAAAHSDLPATEGLARAALYNLGATTHPGDGMASGTGPALRGDIGSRHLLLLVLFANFLFVAWHYVKLERRSRAVAN